VALDEDDADGQSLLLRYPAVSDADRYLRSAVKIEAGAKSALDPNEPRALRPYVAAPRGRADRNSSPRSSMGL
jgi:hypothetical protein